MDGEKDSFKLSSSLLEIQKRLDDLRIRCISDPGNAQEFLSDALEQLQSTLDELSAADEALLWSEAELRLVTDNVPLLLAHVSSDLKYIFVNQSYADWFHLNRSEIIGQHISEVLSKEGYEATLGNIKKALAGEKIDCEVVVQREGRPRVMHIAFIPQLDEQRTMRSYYTVTQDITDRKRAEEALLESERKYRLLVETLQEGIWAIDKDGFTTYVNPSMADMLGYTVEEMQGRHLFSFMDENWKEVAKRNLERRQQGIKEQHDFEFIRKDGSRIYTALETSPITDAHGNYIGALAGVMDITERKKVEEELCKSEVKYRTVADYTYDWELWLDPVGRLLYCSPSCERITGYSADEFLADSNLLRSIVYPDDLEIYDHHFYEGKCEGSYEHEAEFRIVRSDGSVRWIGHACQSVFDDAGQFLGTRGSNRDITERKKADEALQDSEKRYRSLFENMLDGFAYCKMLYDDQDRPIDFVYINVNSAFERLTGLKDVIGKRATEAIPGIKEEHPELFDTYNRVALTGRPEKFEIEFKPLGIWLSISVYSTERGYFVAVFDNITDRKKSEKELHKARDELEMRVAERTMELQKANLALRDAKDHLDMILNSIGDPVFVKDRQHRCILVNDASCKLFGRSRDDIIGRTAYELFPTKEMADISWAKDEEVFLTGVENVNEETNTYASGVTRTVLVKKTPYRDKSGNELLVGVTRDITDRKLVETELQRAKEAAEAAYKAKSEFLANMSHEIRTPMNAVIGLTGLLQRTDLNEEQRDYVETIRSSGDSLLSVINDILDFSKVDSGKIELEAQPFDLKDCVEDSLDLVATEASKKGLDLAYIIDTSAPGIIMGDPARLRQILINLLINAIKFTDKGEVAVYATSRKLDGDDYEIHFAIKDTGIGIPEDKVSHLFQPFSQVDASITRRYGGTGLGLAISKRLVEIMGGRIWAESEVGKGSTFHFTIQAAATTIKPASSKTIVQQPQTDLKLSQSPALRILLAEDNPVSQKVGLQMLRKIGYEADVAANGLEVLQALERQTYDVILMDVQMPEMDGLEATKRIRERWHDGPKIIAVTAYALEGDRDRCLNEGMDDYISKPIQIDELQSKLIKWGTNSKRPKVYS